MSTDVAYPVFRTPDPVLALRTAHRLMEVGRREYSSVSAFAELSSVAEVRRVAKAMPEGWFRGASELEEFRGVPFEDQPAFVVGVPASDLPADEAAFERRLPVEWDVLDQPVDSIEDAFTTTQARSTGSHWSGLMCPRRDSMASPHMLK
ncbi:hypothetical protein QEZ40_006882 [Streptomyces katrae]|uniref:Uncharacterized protein n=1 Tax=Streptomyces katrae TaxID=68223 RepID=A0ABT7H4N2_9ACTN|nr:hypothetical protein [Streptomyces katrae]MDK9500857.1 hypothetical protein [Streptomyces katrae]